MIELVLFATILTAAGAVAVGSQLRQTRKERARWKQVADRIGFHFEGPLASIAVLRKRTDAGTIEITVSPTTVVGEVTASILATPSSAPAAGLMFVPRDPNAVLSLSADIPTGLPGFDRTVLVRGPEQFVYGIAASNVRPIIHSLVAEGGAEFAKGRIKLIISVQPQQRIDETIEKLWLVLPVYGVRDPRFFLAKGALEESSDELRRRCFEAVTNKANSLDELDVFIESGLKDEFPPIRDMAVRLLGVEGRQEAVRFMQDLTIPGPLRADMLMHAAKTYGAYEMKRLVPKFIDDASPAVRAAAIELIGRWRMTELMPQLLQHAKHRSPAPARAALLALGRLRTIEVEPPLLALLDDYSFPYPAEVIEALGMSGHRTAAAALHERMDRLPDHLRAPTLQALDRIKHRLGTGREGGLAIADGGGDLSLGDSLEGAVAEVESE